MSSSNRITEEAINTLFYTIDRLNSYENYSDLKIALEQAGLTSPSVIIGIDFTKSNLFSGHHSNNGRNLHGNEGPYDLVLRSILPGIPREECDKINIFGFGDSSTRSKTIFPILEVDLTIENIIQRYRTIAPFVRLSGPTSIDKIIKYSICEVLRNHNEYHVLIIVSDHLLGEDTDSKIKERIMQAKDMSLSILYIGVGDGPWTSTVKFVSNLRTNNFHFINFNEEIQEFENFDDNNMVKFAANTLKYLTRDYQYIRKKGFDKRNYMRFQLPQNHENDVNAFPEYLQAVIEE